MTELRRDERNVHASLEYANAVLENMAEAVVACDAQARLTLFNRAAQEMHGRDASPVGPEEWADRYDLYLPDGLTKLPANSIPLMRALRGETVRDEEMVIAPAGLPRRTVLASGSRILDPEGRVAGAVVVMLDITERAERQRAIAAAAELESAAASHLRNLDEMRSSLITAVSHEVRTPLTAVSGFARVIAERVHDLEPAQLEEFASAIVRNAERLEQLLGNLVDVARLERSFMTPRLRQTALADLVEGVLDRWRSQSARPFEVSDTASSVDADASILTRILDALIENAIRFSPDGSPVTIEADASDTAVDLRVGDRGPGVPDEEKTCIFEPFEQGSAVPAHSPGLGLGLSLVSGLAALHGGRAWVEDRPGGGALFCVRVSTLSPGGSERSSAGIESLLKLARAQLGMELAFVGEFVGENEIFRHVDAETEAPSIAEGSSLADADTFCRLMLDGELPNVVPAASAQPAVATRGGHTEAGVGAYVGVPIKLSDGRVYGALCCVNRAPTQGLDERSVAALEALAQLVAAELERDDDEAHA